MVEESELDALSNLAFSRGFRLVRKDDRFLLMDNWTNLPAGNELKRSLLFTFDEARTALEQLTRLRPHLLGARTMVAQKAS
jgi:hypothetical protein